MSDNKKVRVDQLKPNMRIMAFTGFEKKYTQLDDKVCKFIQLNFANTRVEIVRDTQTSVCPVSKIQPGDQVKRIFDFPDSLKKLTVVTTPLVQELKKRGFLEFEVIMPPKPVMSKAEKRQQISNNTNELVGQMKESIGTRDEASEAVKEMMDNARKGKVNVEDVKNYVNKIVETSSTEAMKAIASLRSSDQTYAHCTDAGAIYESSYYEIKRRKNEAGIFEDSKMALFAGFMHDFGKAKVPKDVLESNVRFARESREMKLLQSHPMFGAELLANMKVPDYIVNVAHYHHVKMDTSLNSSYPQGTNYDDVLMETRLASIVDVYQALIGKRSYKKSWPPAATMRYLDALVGVEFDPDVWDDFMQVMGRYPISSLVQLNDDSLAFVINVPEEDLDRPCVVVVQNADGTEVTHHTLIDLREEQDVSIVKDLDHYEIFGDRALEVFTNIKLS